LRSNSTGNTNTALGLRALSQNLDGGGNTAAGSQALLNSTGSGNAALGAQAGINLTTGSDNIEIGNAGGATDSKVIRIGSRNVQENTFIAGIYGRIVPSAFQVVVDASGHLGTVINPSSARFKEQIKPMDKASEAILALKPVTFRYKKELDPEGLPQFGLVAEEVEKVNPNLIKRDAAGKPESVRYEAVNAMLLNEFLKEHSKVEQLEATGAEQAKEIKALSAALKEQAAQIQKVSARLELDNPAPRTVLNNQ
jgi:hypothetical protein